MRSLATLSLTLFVAITAAQSISAQPVVTAVENNFSYTLPGLPNYGIAQGSIFIIFGTNLAAAPSGMQPIPLQASLNGVSVQISVGGAVTQALLYYVMPNQIAGVLPSATPFGAGQITVANAGRTSAPAPITVVQSVFGIDTAPGGFGPPARAFDSNGKALSATNAANPGESITLYGTGAGPVPGNEAEAPAVQNLTNIPIEVDIAGVPATVTYHGRSGSPGLDQINVVVPTGASGCTVSVVVNSSGLVSNTATIPVALTGRSCSDAMPGVTIPSSLSLTGKSSYTTGEIRMNRLIQTTPAVIANGTLFPANSEMLDNASGQFQRTTFAQPFGLGFGGGGVFPSLGSCVVSSILFPTPSTPPSGVSGTGTLPPGLTNLNAGPAINFTDSNGKGSATLETSGFYSGILGGGVNGGTIPLFLPSSGGTVTIDNGSGGPDVSSFTTQVNVAPPIVWTNMPAIPSSVDRSQGVTLTWTGGNPSGIASIGATSEIINAADRLIVQVQCSAPVSAGHFTIPPSALLALPPSALIVVGNILPSTSISLGTYDQTSFTLPGFDAAIVTVSVQDSLTVPFY